MRYAIRVGRAVERARRAVPIVIPLLIICTSRFASAQEAEPPIERYRFGSRLSVEVGRFEMAGSTTLPGDSNQFEFSHSTIGFMTGGDWMRFNEGSPWVMSVGLTYAIPFIGALRMPSFTASMGVGLGIDLGSRLRTDMEFEMEFAYYTIKTDSMEWTYRDASLGAGVSAGLSYLLSDSERKPRLQLMAGVSLTMAPLRSITYNHNGTLLDLEVEDVGPFMKLPSVKLSYLMWFP